jgi:hypothetical protein
MLELADGAYDSQAAADSSCQLTAGRCTAAAIMDQKHQFPHVLSMQRLRPLQRSLASNVHVQLS